MPYKKEPPYAFRLCKFHLDEIKKVMQEAQDSQKVSPMEAFINYFVGKPIVLTQAVCAVFNCNEKGAVARIKLK